jgi:hypothetical protein
MVLCDETGAGAGPVPAIFLRSTDGAPPIRLGEGVCSSVSPDGRYVVASDLSSFHHARIVPIGPGPTRELPLGNLHVNFADWMPNGKELVLNGAMKGEAGRNLYLMEIETGAIRRIHDRRIIGQALIISPDGTRMLARTESFHAAIFFLDGSEPRVFEALGQGWRPAGWFADSASFFAYGTGSIPAPIQRVDAETGVREAWGEVAPLVRSGVEGVNSLRISQDGERYAYSYMCNSSALCYAKGLT